MSVSNASYVDLAIASFAGHAGRLDAEHAVAHMANQAHHRARLLAELLGRCQARSSEPS